jgi:hypothetical protein
MTEAVELATAIIASYPTANKTGDGYIGALAATLCFYPASVARQSSDIRQGIMRFCKFLPTVADLVGYCEGFTEPLRRQVDVEMRRVQQFKERDEFIKREEEDRPKRLGIKELKEKYGDWHHNWRVPGDYEREIAAAARAKLIAEVGEEVFNALPDAPARDWFADL